MVTQTADHIDMDLDINPDTQHHQASSPCTIQEQADDEMPPLEGDDPKTAGHGVFFPTHYHDIPFTYQALPLSPSALSEARQDIKMGPLNNPNAKSYQILGSSTSQEQVKAKVLPPKPFNPYAEGGGIIFAPHHQNMTFAHHVTPTRHSVFSGTQQNQTAKEKDMASLLSEIRIINSNLGALTSEFRELKKDTLATRRQIGDLTNEVNALRTDLQTARSTSHGRGQEESHPQELHATPPVKNPFESAERARINHINSSALEGHQKWAAEHTYLGGRTQDIPIPQLPVNDAMRARTGPYTPAAGSNALKAEHQHTTAPRSAQTSTTQQVPKPFVFTQGAGHRARMAAIARNQRVYEQLGDYYNSTEGQAVMPGLVSGYSNCVDGNSGRGDHWTYFNSSEARGRSGRFYRDI